MSSPVYAVNNWFAMSDEASHVRLQELLGETDPNYPPFYPVMIEPQVFPDPIVRYAFIKNPGFHWIQESITLNYAIYSKSYDKLVEIENEIVKIIKGDSSSSRLQNWHDSQGESEWLFHDLRFRNATDLPAPEQEAADFGRLITIEFDYATCDYIV